MNQMNTPATVMAAIPSLCVPLSDVHAFCTSQRANRSQGDQDFAAFVCGMSSYMLLHEVPHKKLKSQSTAVLFVIRSAWNGEDSRSFDHRSLSRLPTCRLMGRRPTAAILSGVACLVLQCLRLLQAAFSLGTSTRAVPRRRQFGPHKASSWAACIGGGIKPRDERLQSAPCEGESFMSSKVPLRSREKCPQCGGSLYYVDSRLSFITGAKKRVCLLPDCRYVEPRRFRVANRKITAC